MFDILWADLWLWLKGVGIGFAVAAPVGPIGMLCIRTALERGRMAGIAAGLGAAVADTLFALVAILSLAAIRDVLAEGKVWFELGGGIFLVVFGIYLALKRVNKGREDEIPPTLWADFGKTLVLTLANPSTILSFMAVFAGVPGTGQVPLGHVWIPISGVLLGAGLWWLGLSLSVSAIRHKISDLALVWLNRAFGGLLVICGLYTLGRLVRLV